MNSRQQILAAIRNINLPDVASPNQAESSMPVKPTIYQDAQAKFKEVLEAIGGTAISCSGPGDLAAELQQIPVWEQASRVWSLVPDIPSRGGDWEAMSDPHAYEPLECCLVPGEFGVAENGSVWVAGQQMPYRSALFIAQHLILVVSGQQIVHNMHEAYARISFEHISFGLFIAGPSKTADIEQSLVIGAHGARSLTVLLV